MDFLVYLQKERELSPGSINQALHALKVYYAKHLGKDWTMWSVLKIKQTKSLPNVLTREEVNLLLMSFRDARYRAFFTVIYQCGLRLTEALNIKPKDINERRLVIRIRVTKGGDEREVPITPELHARLRAFWDAHQNPDWLFPATSGGIKAGMSKREAMRVCKNHMGIGGIYSALNATKHECGLMKQHHKITVHTLRHSYATHLLEAGCSLKQVSGYLGHKDLRATEVYLHLTEMSETKGRKAIRTLATGQKPPQ